MPPRPTRAPANPSVPFVRHPSLQFLRRGNTWKVNHREEAWPITLYARDVYYGTGRLLATLTLDRQDPGMPNPARILTGAVDLLTAAQRTRFAEEAARRMDRAQGGNGAKDESTKVAITAMVDALLEKLAETRYDLEMVALFDVEVPEDLSPKYAVWPIVPKARPGLLIAPSGSGKSTLAGGIAVSVISGTDIVPGITARDHGPVVYIGQEEDAVQMKVRVLQMMRGHKLDLACLADFHYVKLRGGSLVDSAEMVAEAAANIKAKLIIVDSAQATWGGSEDGNVREFASRWFGAVEMLEVPTLVIDHPNLANTKKNTGEMFAAGSGVKRDRAGHVWTVKSIEIPVRDGQPFRYHVTLTDAKRNYVGRQPNIDYETLVYKHEWSKFVEADELDAASVVEASRTFQSIVSHMRKEDHGLHEEGWTVVDLQKEMNAKDDRRIRAELNLGQWRPDPISTEREVTISQVEGTGGRGNPGRYVLETRNIAVQMSMAPGDDDEPEYLS